MGDEKTCPICGKTVKNVTVQNKEITKSDIRDNKAISIFSYIGPLFIIPMVVGNKRKSVFARNTTFFFLTLNAIIHTYYMLKLEVF